MLSPLRARRIFFICRTAPAFSALLAPSATTGTVRCSTPLIGPTTTCTISNVMSPSLPRRSARLQSSSAREIVGVVALASSSRHVAITPSRLGCRPLGSSRGAGGEEGGPNSDRGGIAGGSVRDTVIKLPTVARTPRNQRHGVSRRGSVATAAEDDGDDNASSKPQPQGRRRKKRLGVDSVPASSDQQRPVVVGDEDTPNTNNFSKRKKTAAAKGVGGGAGQTSLPRTREQSLLQQQQQQRSDSPSSPDEAGFFVFGVDEAGRGPLAGPVCAAAAFVPATIPGVTDSKKITSEDERERLFGLIADSPDVRWAAAVVDAGRIDEVNILQATLQGMRMASEALLDWPPPPSERGRVASADRTGCYVVFGGDFEDGVEDDQSTVVSPTAAAAVGGTGDAAAVTPDPTAPTCDGGRRMEDADGASKPSPTAHALVDGNRVPPDMPCPAESIIKGDSKEYCIAAASIVAKVIRDRLMREYDAVYPLHGLSKHKGYPTKMHMEAVRRHGASPIHRRTFAPLKHMDFDARGRVVRE